MKKLNLIVLSTLALAFGRSSAFSTANAAAKPDPADSTPPALPPTALPPEFQKQLDAQAALIAQLQNSQAQQMQAMQANHDEKLEAFQKAASAHLDELESAHEEQMELLQKQLDAAREAAGKPVVVEDTSMLALLAKGAGVDMSDVRWRVAAGLDPETAVQAALLQKNHNESAKEAAKTVAK